MTMFENAVVENLPEKRPFLCWSMRVSPHEAPPKNDKTPDARAIPYSTSNISDSTCRYASPDSDSDTAGLLPEVKPWRSVAKGRLVRGTMVNFAYSTPLRRAIARQFAASPSDQAEAASSVSNDFTPVGIAGISECQISFYQNMWENILIQKYLMILIGAHSSRAALPGPCDHQDQTVTGLNKCGAHQPLLALASESEALAAPLELGNIDTRYRRLLTPPGTRWKFRLSHTATEGPPVEAGVGFVGANNWADIEVHQSQMPHSAHSRCRYTHPHPHPHPHPHTQVPLSLELAGHGQPFYTNFVYPFKCDPPKVADGINYVGCYQTEIQIPSAWRGRRIFLYFEGAGSALQCWLDTRFVGYSQDSFLPAEFEITAHVQPKWGSPGEDEGMGVAGVGGDGSANGDSDGAPLSCTLSVKTYRFCDGSYMEAQDMWWLSGMYPPPHVTCMYPPPHMTCMYPPPHMCWLSGIHRDVVLYSKPACAHIWDYRIITQPAAGTAGPTDSRWWSIKVEVEVRKLDSRVCEAIGGCGVVLGGGGGGGAGGVGGGGRGGGGRGRGGDALSLVATTYEEEDTCMSNGRGGDASSLAPVAAEAESAASRGGWGGGGEGGGGMQGACHVPGGGGGGGEGGGRGGAGAIGKERAGNERVRVSVYGPHRLQPHATSTVPDKAIISNVCAVAYLV